MQVQILNPDASLRPDMNATVKCLATTLRANPTLLPPRRVFLFPPCYHDPTHEFVFLLCRFEVQATEREVPYFRNAAAAC